MLPGLHGIQHLEQVPHDLPFGLYFQVAVLASPGLETAQFVVPGWGR